MNNLLNNGDPLLSQAGVDLETETPNLHGVRLDLGEDAPLNFGGLVVMAQTSNVQQTPTAVKVHFAFSHRALDAATAPERLQTRETSITCNLAAGTGLGGTREHASARVPITGRYLYAWLSSPSAGTAGDAVDVEVHAGLIK